MVSVAGVVIMLYQIEDTECEYKVGKKSYYINCEIDVDYNYEPATPAVYSYNSSMPQAPEGASAEITGFDIVGEVIILNEEGDETSCDPEDLIWVIINTHLDWEKVEEFIVERVD